MSLEIVDVTLTFPDGQGRVTALDRVSLAVSAGSVTGVIGQSGSGKSSLLAVAATLIHPDSGRVLIDDIDATQLDPTEATSLRRQKIGIVFQLADDLIDIASESGETGKTPGTDLREGVPTLPIIYVLRGTDPGEARLRELVQRLKAENRNVYLEIQGHTDATGDAKANEALGLARAEAVRRFMSREGIALNRIATISYGDTAPVASGCERSTS